MTIMRSLPNGLSVASLNRSETDYLYKEIFEDEAYLPAQGLRLRAEPVIFDVGANIGLFALYALRTWPRGRIFAFEPAPAVFDALRRNLGEAAKVELYNIALGDARETRELRYYPRYTMMSGFTADPAADRALARSCFETTAAGLDPGDRELLLAAADAMFDGSFGQETVPCPVERLSDVVEVAGVDRIDLLKVDVEGHELPVLRGIDEELWPRVDHIVVEVADRSGELSEIRELFAAHGMRTSVRQSAEFRNSNLFMVFADRE